MRFVLKSIGVVFAIAVFLLGLVWLLVSSPLFSTVRAGFVEDLLSRQTGQEVLIEGDVRLGLGRSLHLSATGLTFPGSSQIDADLAAIDELSFDAALRDLLGRKLSLRNIEASGVHLNLISAAGGETNWAVVSAADAPDQADPNAASAPGLDLSNLVSDRQININDVRILYQSAQNGLDLDLRLPALALKRDAQTNVATARAAGTLNAEPFDLKATFPQGAPFQVLIDFDDIAIAANQIPDVPGLQVKTTVEVAQLGQLLDVVKLNRVLEGDGNIAATFKAVEGVTRIDDLDIAAQIEGGQSLSLTGQIGVLNSPDDVSLTTRIRLYPEDAEPPAAESRYDLKIVAVDMVIDSKPGQVPQRQMVIKTNGFTLDTSGEGPPPIKFSELSRTADGALRVGNIDFRVGDLADPFIILTGSVEDALQLQGISAEGLIDIPARSLLSSDQLGPEDRLGTFAGDFHLNGDFTQLSLTDLDGKTRGTEVWDLRVTGTVRNVLRFEDLDLAIDVGVPSGADLLEALSLKAVDTGPTHLGIKLVSQGTDWDVNADVEVAESALSLVADLDDATQDPVLRGTIESGLIKIGQVRQIVAAAAQLSRLGGSDAAPDAPDGADSPLRDVTLQPIGQSILLSGIDVDVAIDLRQIEGAKGISRIQTDLKLNETELSAGPLAFEYGGGQFDVSAHMDLRDEAHILNINGKAGGWQLHDILHSLNLNKGASGTLYADFKVGGGITSPSQFIATMNGSATVSMRNGSIETQLLDLAGLGVLPWVFTKEKQKVAPIVCLRAPLRIANGTVSTDRTALETDHVQIVVLGGVNLAKKAIDLDLQPRKIGKPLSRSPWPVTLKGSLSKPKVKVKDGPKRVRRSDGADTMPAKRQPCVPDILQLQ